MTYRSSPFSSLGHVEGPQCQVGQSYPLSCLRSRRSVILIGRPDRDAQIGAA
jgi:hypothetical protein